MAHSHSHDGGIGHSHDDPFNGHGHSHEILDGPGSYVNREMPLIEGRDWKDRAFTIGIGGYVPHHGIIHINLLDDDLPRNALSPHLNYTLTVVDKHKLADLSDRARQPSCWLCATLSATSIILQP